MANIDKKQLEEIFENTEHELTLKERAHMARMTKKLPVFFLVDGTLNMQEKSGEVYLGIKKFLELITQDERTKEAVDLAVLTFTDKLNLLRKLAPIKEKDKVILHLPEEAGEFTLSLPYLIDYIKEAYQGYFKEEIILPQCWLFIFTNTSFEGPGFEEFDKKVFDEDFSTFMQTVVFSYSKEAEVDLLGSTSPLGNNIVLPGKSEELFTWLAENLARFASHTEIEQDFLDFSPDAVKPWRQ